MKKTTQEIFMDGIKRMHPFFLSYLRQRLEADVKKIIEAIPSLYEQDKADMEEGKLSIGISPDFYVTYVNSLLEMFDEIDGTKTPRIPYGIEANRVFEDTNTRRKFGEAMSKTHQDADSLN